MWLDDLRHLSQCPEHGWGSAAVRSSSHPYHPCLEPVHTQLTPGKDHSGIRLWAVTDRWPSWSTRVIGCQPLAASRSLWAAPGLTFQRKGPALTPEAQEGTWPPSILLRIFLCARRAITWICIHICICHQVFSQHTQHQELEFPTSVPCGRTANQSCSRSWAFRWCLPLHASCFQRQKRARPPHCFSRVQIKVFPSHNLKYAPGVPPSRVLSLLRTTSYLIIRKKTWFNW